MPITVFSSGFFEGIVGVGQGLGGGGGGGGMVGGIMFTVCCERDY